MNIFLYFRTYWGNPESSGMSGRNILAKSKLELVSTTIKSLELNTIHNIHTCACVDLSTPNYTKFLESKFDEIFHTKEGFDVNDHKGCLPVFGGMGNSIKVFNYIKSKNHKDDDVVLLLEDDYLFNSNGFKSWIESCAELDGFVSPFDHPDRYLRRDDMFFKKSEIIISNNHHFKMCESSTGVIGARYKYFRKTHFLRKIPRFHIWFFWPGRIFGNELPSIDRVFYRRAYFFCRVKLFSPIPGFAVHLSKFIRPENESVFRKSIEKLPETQLSAGVDWISRYKNLTS